jgi:hypothetical protein
MRLESDNHLGEQNSCTWQHSLPNGQQVQVFLVADPQALEFICSQILLHQGPNTMTSIDIQGVNLRAAAGRLCLLQLACMTANGLVCVLFDIMQLGESVGRLQQFLEDPNIPKFMYNAKLGSTVLAHKFGITFSGVIDLGTAYEMICSDSRDSRSQSSLGSLVDYFEWCNMAVPNLKQEYDKMEQNAEWWAHRPLANRCMHFAVTGVCTLYGTYPILVEKLVRRLGQSSREELARRSQQLVTVHATGGWSCRNAGLWIGEQGAEPSREDPELDDWISRRMHKGPSAAARRLSPEKVIRAQQAELPPSAVRAEDSPRTASWRAAVAAVAAPSRTDGRQRSASPTLESWLASREQVKSGQPAQKSQRSASVPVPRSKPQKKEEDAPTETTVFSGPFGIGMDLFNSQGPRRAWADHDDKDGAEDEGEDIFRHLGEVEKARLRESQ